MKDPTHTERNPMAISRQTRSNPSGVLMSTTAGLDVVNLTDYLSRHVPGSPDLTDIALIEGGRSNITYDLTTSAGSLILRRPPLGDVAQSANDVLREYRVMDALQGTTVPVPRTIAFCDDTAVIGAPFTLVAKVSGRVLRSPADVAQLTPDEMARCAEQLVLRLADLHALDYDRIGLGTLGRPIGFVARQVERWQAQWTHVHTRDLHASDELFKQLRSSIPTKSRASIVHGDYRLDNVMLADDDPARVNAVLDWEMATLGDPLTDLGLMLVYWDPVCAPVLPYGHPFAGNEHVPSANHVAELYRDASGCSLEHLDFYRALGYFKLAVIAEGIHGRFVAGLTVGEGFETVGLAVEQLLERGLDVLAAMTGTI